MNQIELPAVEPDEDDARWWEALQAGELRLASCETCGTKWSRPLPGCPNCGSASIIELTSQGRGRVYSWVTVRRALDPAFSSQTPYTIVVVDLDEDCRVMGRFIEPQAPSAGDRVEFTPYRQGDTMLVGFAPAGNEIA
jgi:uncharacterized OB-fold protein